MFSTTNDCPIERPSWSANVRPIRSSPPPGWAGTTIRTGFAGYPWATALSQRTAKTKLAAKRNEIERSIEGSFREGEKLSRERIRPAPVRGIAAELALDVLARERLVNAAADVRLAFLEHASVLERHADVAGVRLGIGVIRIHHVAHLAREIQDARIVYGCFAERLESRAAGDERDRDIERRTEL